MNKEALEARLQENEGVLHGLMQAVCFLAARVKHEPGYMQAAEQFIAGTAAANLTAGLSDYSLEQSEQLLRQLLLQS